MECEWCLKFFPVCQQAVNAFKCSLSSHIVSVKHFRGKPDLWCFRYPALNCGKQVGRLSIKNISNLLKSWNLVVSLVIHYMIKRSR